MMNYSFQRSLSQNFGEKLDLALRIFFTAAYCAFPLKYCLQISFCDTTLFYVSQNSKIVKLKAAQKLFFLLY